MEIDFLLHYFAGDVLISRKIRCNTGLTVILLMSSKVLNLLLHMKLVMLIVSTTYNLAVIALYKTP